MGAPDLPHSVDDGTTTVQDTSLVPCQVFP